MTLPPGSTAPEAIRCLARMVREGVAYGRGARMKSVRRFYKVQVRRLFKMQPRPMRRVALARQAAAGIVFRRGPITVSCVYPRPEGLSFPAAWSARFVERITFPVIRKTLTYDQHPFRLSLEVQRGSRKIKIDVHDARDTWLGPTQKARLRFFTPPWTPPLAPGTYLVFGDYLSDASLRRWLTLLLAQRSMLTEDEEVDAVARFFVRGARDDEEKDIRREAFEVLKRRFFQPIGGRLSFPAYYHQTLKMLRVRQRVQEGNLFAFRDSALVSLGELRWSEPNLHRAILDRIATGKVKPVEQGGALWVSSAVAEEIENQRLRNARARQPKRLAGKRVGWINELVSKGERRASARRKVKRWINKLGLSEEDIRASIHHGRVMRVSGQTSRR